MPSAVPPGVATVTSSVRTEAASSKRLSSSQAPRRLTRSAMAWRSASSCVVMSAPFVGDTNDSRFVGVANDWLGKLPPMSADSAARRTPREATPRRLARLPSWLVGQLALDARRLVGEALAQAGVRRHHFAVLAALDEQGATSQAELGRRLWIDRSDLHAVLNELERDGLVARVRDAADRR